MVNEAEMSNEPITCQDLQLPAASRRLNQFFVPVQRVRWHVQNEGVIRTIIKMLRKVASAAIGSSTKDGQPWMNVQDYQLGLQTGEWVQVKSLSEIKATLDARCTFRGLGFMPGMEQFCGKEYPVLKRVEQIVIEGATGKNRVRRMKNTVILEGLHCNGAEVRCDRGCFYFWREAWLRRVSHT